MNDKAMYAVILAGGVGTRLWPRSRRHLPKQMLDLTGQRTMIQQTLDRIAPLIPPERVWVVTNEDYVPLVQAQLPELPPAQVIGEPAPRGTAPAIALGAEFVARVAPEGTMFALHADHFISDEQAFREGMKVAARVAEEGWLVNLGVRPERPETGYGYVELGAPLDGVDGRAFEVRRFREKPDLATATAYVASERYLWNSGIFCWRTDVIQSAFERFLPDVAAAMRRVGEGLGRTTPRDAIAAGWAQLEREISIDVGIMERAARVATVPIDAGWNDVGAWDSLANLLPSDAQGNSVSGAGNSLMLDARNVFVYSEGKTVAVVGVEDLVIIDTEDALLVMPRDRAQEVRELVRRLRHEGLEDLL